MFSKNLIQKWEDPCVFPTLNERKGSALSNKDLLRLSNNFHRVEFELKHPEGLSLESMDKGALFGDAMTRFETYNDCLESDSDFGSPLKPLYNDRNPIFALEKDIAFKREVQEVELQF